MVESVFDSDFFEHLITEFGESNIKYCVLRNYQGLPSSNTSKDVDLLIAPNSKEEVISIVNCVCNSLNSQMIKYTTLDYLTSFVFCRHDENLESALFSIKLDFFFGLSWRGIQYVKYERVLQNAIDYNGIMVISDADFLLTTLLYNLLYAKGIKPKYYEVLHTKYKADRTGFNFASGKELGEDLTSVINSALEKEEFSKIDELRPLVCKRLIKTNLLDLGYYKSFLSHIYSEIRFKSKKGPFIAFFGPDGSGKSSIIEHVIEFYCGLGMSRNSVSGHFIPPEIPPPHKLFFSPKKVKNQNYTKPYSSKPAGFLSSQVRALYYLVAFIIARVFCVSPLLRQDLIVFYDRYFLDLIVDPTRYRIRYISKIIKIGYKILRLPDLMFYIDVDQERIIARKKELSPEKIRYLKGRYEELVDKFENMITIDNNSSLNISVEQTIQEINKYLSENIR